MGVRGTVKRSHFIGSNMSGKQILISTLAGAVLFGAGWWAAARVQAQPKNVIASYHRWYHAHGDQTYNNTNWRGVPVQKCPLDLWVFQEILNDTKPDVIVEAGTYKGGSSYYMASILNMIGHGRIVTIDIEDYPGKPQHDRVRFLHGSSTAPEIVQAVKDSVHEGEKVMVVLDSAHEGDHVLKELELYSSLVSKGCYLIVEDTHFNGHPILPNFGYGPMEALHDFLETAGGQFEIDSSRQKFGMSFNPDGYLKRVR